MKKLIATLLSAILLVGMLASCAPAEESAATEPDAATDTVADTDDGEEAAESGGEIETFTVYVPSESVLGFEVLEEMYAEKVEGFDIDIISYADVTEFETTMTAKIASNDIPDMIMSQVSTVINDYASNGYTIPITDLGILDLIIDGETTLLYYNDEIYAYPYSYGSSGVVVNNDTLAAYGLEMTYEDTPQSIYEFIDWCEKLQEAGLEYPITVGAQDSSPATAFVFQYIYQNVYGVDPNWYANVLRGETGWDGDEFKAVYEAYDKLLPYINADALGTDGDGSKRDFVTGEAAFYFDVSGVLTSMRELDESLDLSFILPPFSENPEDMTAVVGFDSAISISATAPDTELCKDFLLWMFEDTSAVQAYYDQTSGGNSTVKAANIVADEALGFYNQALADGAESCAMLSREWISGIKEVMKSGTQDWFAGVSIDEVCATIEEEHDRLMEGNPDYVTSFLDSYVDIVE